MMKKMSWFTSAVIILITGAAWGKSLDIGKPAPDFTLTDTAGNTVSLKQFARRFIVLEWTNPSCPFVKNQYGSGNMQKLQEKWTKLNVAWISICSSAKGKQGFMNSEDWQKTLAEKGSKATVTLLDPSGKVGKTYGAKTTPHMFVLDPKGNLIYQGALDTFQSFDDDPTQLNNYVNTTLSEAMAGKKVSTPKTEPYGCSVKY